MSLLVEDWVSKAAAMQVGAPETLGLAKIKSTGNIQPVRAQGPAPLRHELGAPSQ
jgi:hypothetical protein